MEIKRFFTYITTNPTKTVIYVGASNDLPQRLSEHYLNRGQNATFAGRYNCYNLIYFETYYSSGDAFARESQIKGWTRKKKVQLIEIENPDWRFLNADIIEWPPKDDAVKRYEK